MLLFIYYILMTIKLCSCTPYKVNNHLRQKLDAVERNAICCMNNLQCCKTSEKYPNFEVKTILTDCPKKKCNYTSSQIVVNHNKSKGAPEKLTDCRQKLLLTIKIINQGVFNEKSQYVVIDHVIDSGTMRKIKILNPYVVRIRQEQLMQVYGVQFERAVNAEAREVVHNKHHDRFYRGCDTESENPTCGAVKQNGKLVPYSTGFCCSCDNEKNRRMEELMHKELISDDDIFGSASSQFDNNYERVKRDNDDIYYIKGERLRQRRGGQSCDDLNYDSLPESFHESTHCLKFSNLWYSVYRLEKPFILHQLKIQLYQKYEDCHGNTHWMDLTKGQVIKLGTASSCNLPELNIIARYSADEIHDCNFALDYKKQKIMIPEKKVDSADKFMVVPKNIVSNGKSCNTAGVGYEAFYKQKKRCARPKGSCLGNQPQHFYDQDEQAEADGKSGNYFLKFFGNLADEPVIYNSSGQIQYLRLTYSKRHVSTVYFELNADLVTLMEPNAFATVSEVYTDATDVKKTRIIVKVTNSGLVYGIFYVRLTGCPLSVPASFNNIASKSVLIAPQHQHIFNLFIDYPLSSSQIICRIQVHNIYQELIAFRDVRIQAYDRCICIWYCECACYVADGGLKCIPISLEKYHSAGFQGGFPFPTNVLESSFLDDLLALFFHMFIILVLTLLGMGLIKALLGLCSREIGLWGLNTIIGTDDSAQSICDNKDCEYRQENNISLSAQFCLNLIFFFIYPLALINIAIKNMCFSNYTLEDDSCSCEERWIDYENCQDPENCSLRKRKSSMESSAKTISMEYTSSENKGSDAK